MPRRICLIAFASFLPLVLAACSASSTVVDDRPAIEVVGPTSWSDAETLNVNAYPDTAPVSDEEVVHDVPASLMNSTADDGTTIEISGYRVQIFSSIDRAETATAEEQARRWLDSMDDVRRDTLGLSEHVEIYNLFRQPYYRVRLGDFEDREAAILIAGEIRRLFPTSLVVPDMIQVLR